MRSRHIVCTGWTSGGVLRYISKGNLAPEAVMHLKVHHLNCGTLCPVCRRFMNGEGGWLEPGRLVCHCLLIETPDSLVLVDTGLGTDDIRQPSRRLGLAGTLLRPRLDPDETALAQVGALGYRPSDVRHIVVTHLDLDHAGGLSDFPDAQVHLTRRELNAALAPTLRDRARYRAPQFGHHPRWQQHSPEEGDDWFGFHARAIIPALAGELLMVSLPGHSRGHCGVAVKQGARWLLHAGDAFFHRATLVDPDAVPPGLQLVERLDESNRGLRMDTASRLRHLARTRGDAVRIFCAHDPEQWRQLSDSQSSG